MFKKFSSEEVSAQNQVKASVQRKIRQSIADEYPGLEPVLEDLLPKKSPLIVAKCQNHLNLVLVNNVPLFFNIRDGPYMPTLRLLHQYPNIMKKLQVDRGAIKFVLSGANIMCPGLTSPGGALDDEVDAETPVKGNNMLSLSDLQKCLPKIYEQLTRGLVWIICIILMMASGRWNAWIEFFQIKGASMAGKFEGYKCLLLSDLSVFLLLSPCNFFFFLGLLIFVVGNSKTWFFPGIGL